MNTKSMLAAATRLQNATLSWDFTRTCNLSCGHCSNADDRASAAADLRLEAAAHLLGEFRLSGGVGLHLLGGEPLLRKDFLTVVRLGRELGLQVSVTTNGTVVPDDDAIDWLMQNLAVITVSLDGHEAAVNDPIRGRGTFDAAVGSLHRYRERRDAISGGAKINISHVLCASNVRHVESMMALASAIAADTLSITYLKRYGNALRLDAPRPARPEELLAAMDRAASLACETAARVVLFEVPRRLRETLQERHGKAAEFGGDSYCDTAEGQLRVSSDGRVYPCFAGTKHISKTGDPLSALDARHVPLPEILDGEIYHEFKYDAHVRLRETPWRICRGCAHFADRSCYPGCPYEPENMKPRLCQLLEVGR
ncbi:radical SAM protein [Sorangium sp. So ce367]|uniref:radical SAM protein n=1 Tax=Sorangium sp. So ce367 TaxID=3133305 RepID=UPI003F602BC7